MPIEGTDQTMQFAIMLACTGLVLVIFLFYSTFKNRKSRQNKVAAAEKPAEELSIISNVLDKVSFPVWERNNDLTLKYFNKIYQRITLKDGAIQVELFSGAKDLAEKAKSTGIIQSVKKHVIIEGQRRLLEITEIPVLNSGTIGFARDITEFEEIEKELKEHMQVQSKLLESSASAIAIYGSDKRLKFFNPAFVNLWKMDERWLSSQPTYGEILEVLREKRKLPEQANFQKFKKTSLDMFTNLIEKNEELYFLPDGIILRVVIIPHEHGGLLFSYEDMTNQIALERSYNTLLSVNKSTIDNLYEGIVVFGENGRVQLFNPVFADMWQLEHSFLKSEPHISDVLEECKFLYDFGSDWEAYKQKIISFTNQRTASREKLLRTDGSILEMSCIPMPNGTNLITYIDITDSSRVENSLRAEKEALEEADRIKSNFLANVSYELRSPLTSIKGFSEILIKKLFGDMNIKQEEYVKGIYDSSQRLASLIDNILDVASIDAGYMKLEIEEFDIKKMLDDASSAVAPGIKKHDLELECKYTDKVGDMFGDKKRIQQAISSLLNNAISFTEPGGKITLSAESRESDIIAIGVEDTGRGIPLDEQKYVFQKFYKSNSDSYSGTGLGLTITKSFIELHGGTVELRSEIGVGTKITCLLKRKNHDLLQAPKVKNA